MKTIPKKNWKVGASDVFYLPPLVLVEQRLFTPVIEAKHGRALLFVIRTPIYVGSALFFKKSIAGMTGLI